MVFGVDKAAKKKTPAKKGKTPKKETVKNPQNKHLVQDAGVKCPKGPRAKIQAYILQKCTMAQLKKVHARYFITPNKEGRKVPRAEITVAALRNDLREVWGM